MARYRWRRVTGGTLYLHGVPARRDPKNPQRLIPGTSSVTVKFGPPDFPPHIFETFDGSIDLAIRQTQKFKSGQIALDGGVVGTVAMARGTVTDLADILRLGGLTPLPSDEPEWGAIDFTGL